MEIRSVEAVVKALNSARVQYLIVGGLAVIAHGYERLTGDIDLVIQLEPENIVRGLRALIAIGYRPGIPVTPEDFADASKRESWRKDKHMFVLKLWSDTHRRTPVDVFVFEPFDFSREIVAAKWEIIGPGLQAPMVCYSTLLEMKRVAGRPQDWADIANLEELKEDEPHD